jgi:hypothetical protein
MKTLNRSRLALLCALCLFANPAQLQAQLTKIFVASFGNDGNDGSRGSPKRNFQAAHNAVAAGGQIVVLDTAGYGQLNITKSVAVTVPPGVNGFITALSGTYAININTAVSDTVSLRGLIVEGNATYGISATSVGTLRIEDCTIRGSFFTALFMSVNNSAHLVMNQTRVYDATGGVQLDTTNDVSLIANLTACTIDRIGNTGVLARAPTTGSSTQVTARDCVVTNNPVGFATTGAGAAIVVDNCTISGGTNAFAKTDNAGTIYTRGNNTVSFISGSLINGSNTTTAMPAY